jgi:hypothetical protein
VSIAAIGYAPTNVRGCKTGVAVPVGATRLPAVAPAARRFAIAAASCAWPTAVAARKRASGGTGAASGEGGGARIGVCSGFEDPNSDSGGLPFTA